MSHSKIKEFIRRMPGGSELSGAEVTQFAALPRKKRDAVLLPIKNLSKLDHDSLNRNPEGAADMLREALRKHQPAFVSRRVS